MKQNIKNKDKQGKRHGKQIRYYPNGNIFCIDNYHHGKWHGYQAFFNDDNSIEYKEYYNMGNSIYSEDHYHKHIQINI